MELSQIFLLFGCVTLGGCANNKSYDKTKKPTYVKRKNFFAADPIVDNKTATLDGPSVNAIPFMVSIQAPNEKTGLYEHLCGGSIIHEEFVITAAHCFHAKPKNVSIVGGSNKLLMPSYNSPDRRKLRTLVIHEQYWPLMGRDIALLRVSPKFVFDGQHYDKIDYNVTEKVKSKVDAYLIGWGRMKGITDRPLELVSFRSLDSFECRDRGFIYISSTEMCAISYRGRGACDGDSGGPLVNTEFNKQIGLLSYGEVPCKRYKIYAFTHLYRLVNWLATEMNKLLISEKP